VINFPGLAMGDFTSCRCGEWHGFTVDMDPAGNKNDIILSRILTNFEIIRM